MKFQGESFFQAPRDQVWAAIVEPRTLLAKIGGFQRLDPIGDHEYEGAFEVSLGEVRGDFQGTLELADLKPPSSLRFSLNAMGAAGFVDGDGLMVLEEAGGGTRIHYDLDAKIGGRIATVGERALQEAAALLARQTLENLEGPAPPPPSRIRVVTRQEVSVPPPEETTPTEEPTRPSPQPAVDPVDLPGPSEPAADAPIDLAPEPPSAPAQEISSPGRSATAPAGPPVPSPPSEPSPPRQGQYASRVSGNVTEQLSALATRPEVLGVALVLYTLFVVLLTRSCS